MRVHALLSHLMLLEDVLKIGFAFSVAFPGLAHRSFPPSSGERCLDTK